MKEIRLLSMWSVIFLALLSGCKKDDEPIKFNIEPGDRVGDYYLGDNLQTNISKIVTKLGTLSWLDHTSFDWTGDLYWNEILCDTLGVKFIVIKDNTNMDNNDVPDIIMAYEPFDGRTAKGITFGSYLTKVSSAYGTPDYVDPDYGDYYYDVLGIGFYADNTNTRVSSILIYEPGFFKSTDRKIIRP